MTGKGWGGMKYSVPLLAALLSAVLPPLLNAGELTVSRSGVVAPNVELEEFIGDLRRAIMSAKMRDYAVFDAFFAPRIRVFRRGLDPQQPWKAGDAISEAPLRQLADMLVEREAAANTQSERNYREDALRAVLKIIWAKKPLGSMKEVPGATCLPAQYDFDQDAALAFARQTGRDLSDLRFFDHILFLLAAPGGKKGSFLRPNTLAIADPEQMAPPGWHRYKTAGGIAGYVQERLEPKRLAQRHLCFSKVDGAYRITAVFGYGL